MRTCVHCGAEIVQSENGDWSHTRGRGSLIHRCQTDAVPYGHNAHPEMPWPVNGINDCMCTFEEPCLHIAPTQHEREVEDLADFISDERDKFPRVSDDMDSEELAQKILKWQAERAGTTNQHSDLIEEIRARVEPYTRWSHEPKIQGLAKDAMTLIEAYVPITRKREELARTISEFLRNRWPSGTTIEVKYSAETPLAFDLADAILAPQQSWRGKFPEFAEWLGQSSAQPNVREDLITLLMTEPAWRAITQMDVKKLADALLDSSHFPLLADAWDAGVMAKSNSSSIFDRDVLAKNPYRAASQPTTEVVHFAPWGAYETACGLPVGGPRDTALSSPSDRWANTTCPQCLAKEPTSAPASRPPLTNKQRGILSTSRAMRGNRNAAKKPPRCPVHDQTDCSPLLNGCSLLTNPQKD